MKLKNKLDLMFESDFVRVPRPFVRKFNLNTAVMLSEIYSEYTYWRERDGLQNGGWFYSTIENIDYNTGLSKHQQFVAVKELENYGIIKVKYQGMPKKRYFKFDAVAFNKLYDDFQLHSNRTEEETETTEMLEVPRRNFSGFSF
jgi:hypothetical protein